MVPSSHFFSLPSPPVALPPKPAAGFAAAPRAPAGPGLLGPPGGRYPDLCQGSNKLCPGIAYLILVTSDPFSTCTEAVCRYYSLHVKHAQLGPPHEGEGCPRKQVGWGKLSEFCTGAALPRAKPSEFCVPAPKLLSPTPCSRSPLLPAPQPHAPLDACLHGESLPGVAG